MSLIRDKKWCYTKTRNNYPIQRYKKCPDKKINHQDSTLFAIGSEEPGDKLWYSDNGINWSNQDITGVEENIKYINDIAFKFIDLSNIIYIAGGAAINSSLLYSYNKKDWFYQDISYNTNNSIILSITYALNKFVAISETSLMYSYDGLEWFDSMVNELNLNNVYYGDKFIAINTSELNDISSELLYSSDGINWTQNNLDTFHFEKINNIKFYNDKWYIVGNVHNVMWIVIGDQIQYSYNGRDFENNNLIINNHSGDLISFGKDENYNSLILTSDGYYSKNGLKWYQNITDINKKPYYIKYINDFNKPLWFILNEEPVANIAFSNILKYSFNGFDFYDISINENIYVVFKQYNIEHSKTNLNNDIFLASGFFFIIKNNDYYEYSLIKSQNGIDFTPHDIKLFDLSGNIITDNDILWVVVGSDNPDFVSGTASKSISYSYNLLDWYDASYNFFNWGSDIDIGKDVNGNNMFVAVGKHNTAYGNIVWSYDGINWTQSSGDNFSEYGRDITYGNFDGSNIWLATGYDTISNNIVLKSYDGKNWTSILTSNQTSELINGHGIIIGKDLSNNKDIVVVCGFNGGGGNSTTPYYSTNLQDFSAVNMGSAGYSQYEIEYYNGLFVIVGSTNPTINSDILWSEDGIKFNNATDNNDISFNTSGLIYNIKHGFDSSGDEIWVAVGYVENGINKYQRIWWSKNGKTWDNTNTFDIQFITNQPQPQYGLYNGYDLSGDYIWVFYGYGEYYTSSDGKNWTDRSNETNNRNVTYGAGLVQNMFKFINIFENNKTINSDYDDYNLKIGKNNNNQEIWLTYNIYNINFNLYYYSYNNINWYLSNYNFNNFYPKDLDFGYDNSNNPIFVIGGSFNIDISLGILYSYDGINWQNSYLLNINNQINDYINYVKYGKDNNGNNLWMSSGIIEGVINYIYSYNGIEWSLVSNNNNILNSQITFGELDRPVIIESVDGISGWTEIETTNFFDDECKNIVFRKINDEESSNDPCKPDIITSEWLTIGNNDYIDSTILNSNNLINWNDVSNDYNNITDVSDLSIIIKDIIYFKNYYITIATLSYSFSNCIIDGSGTICTSGYFSGTKIKYSYDGKYWYDAEDILPPDTIKLIDASWKYTETIPGKVICEPKAIFKTPPTGSFASAKSRFSHIASNSIRGNSRYSGKYTSVDKSNNIYGVSTRPINKF